MTSTIKVNTITTESGSTLTVGGCGKTVALASGASQTGFGRTGTVNWVTSVKTNSDSPLTVESGKGYFLNTTSGTITVNLPAGSAGDIVAFKDYANTWDNNNVTVTPNGSDKIGGSNSNTVLSTESQSVTLIFTDSTRGWLDIHDSTSNVEGAKFITATGGTITTVCTNFKVHTFTGPGTFCVSCAGNAAGSNSVDYLVVAGGGAGGKAPTSNDGAGAGGGGGFRLSNSTSMPAPLTSPLAAASGQPVTATGFPITVGAGASAAPGRGDNGSDSIFSVITSAGGGGGGTFPDDGTVSKGRDGGSGGGGSGGNASGPTSVGGTGNTPPVSPPQGQSGGAGATSPNFYGGGGGGAGGVGDPGDSPATDGGVGSFVVSAGFAGCNGTPGPVGSARFFSGGGAGAPAPGRPTGKGGTGGAGGGGPSLGPTAGTVNTGGGGAGGRAGNSGEAGGSGIVIIRYKFQ